MSYQDNGGPMHPVNHADHWLPGISARDYFAAQAPLGIPSWFTLTTPPAMSDAADLSEAELEEQLKAHAKQQDAMRFFAWRWYYADMMLQMRCDPNVGVPQPQTGASL